MTFAPNYPRCMSGKVAISGCVKDISHLNKIIIDFVLRWNINALYNNQLKNAYYSIQFT